MLRWLVKNRLTGPALVTLFQYHKFSWLKVGHVILGKLEKEKKTDLYYGRDVRLLGDS